MTRLAFLILMVYSSSEEIDTGIPVANVASINALQASVAQAERLVRQDQSRVNQDASRLDQSQSQLSKDKQDLADTRRDSARAEQTAPKAAPAINLNNAIEQPSRAEVAAVSPSAARPQLNSLGQTIGRLIDVVA